METTPYLAACLLAALFGVGALSWLLARYRQHSELRRAQAQQLLAALERYSEWVRAQRMATVFEGEGAEAAAALDEACTIRVSCFPGLAGDMAELLAVHNRLINFLSTQQALWLRDPEHWLRTEHDKRFMALWRQHRFALQALLSRLEQAASVRIQPVTTAPRSESTYA
jgi:hypothetical protein